MCMRSGFPASVAAQTGYQAFGAHPFPGSRDAVASPRTLVKSSIAPDWELANERTQIKWREKMALRTDGGMVGSLAFSPDGETLASGSKDRIIRFWDMTTGAEATSLRLQNAPGPVAFSPNGRLLAFVAQYNHVKLWKVSTWTEVRTIGVETASATPLTFSPNSLLIAFLSVTGKLEVWDVDSGRELTRVGNSIEKFNSLAFSPDGRLLASTGKGSLRTSVWNVATGALCAHFDDHLFEPVAVAFTPSGRLLVSVESDQGAVVLNPGTAEEVKRFEGNHISNTTFDAAFSLDRQLVALTLRIRTIGLFDVASWTEVAQLEGHTRDVEAIAFSSDGKAVAAGLLDGTVTVWSRRRKRNNVESKPFGKRSDSGSFDGTVRLWSSEESRMIMSCDTFGKRLRNFFR